jgi:ADP-heptose:LPS heptosyltransferase
VNLSLAKSLDRVAGGVLCGVLSAFDRVASGVRRAPAPIEEVKGLLVVKLWGLGNWALLRPIVRDLRARWPGARLTIVTLRANAPLVTDLADEVLLVRPDGFLRTALDLLASVRRLRRAPPEMSIDFEQFSTVGALLSRRRASRSVSASAAAPARGRAVHRPRPFRQDVHASRSFRDLAEAAGVGAGPAAGASRRRGARGGAVPRRRPVRRRRTSPLVLLHPGPATTSPAAGGRRRVRGRGRQAIQRHGRRWS